MISVAPPTTKTGTSATTPDPARSRTDRRRAGPPARRFCFRARLRAALCPRPLPMRPGRPAQLSPPARPHAALRRGVPASGTRTRAACPPCTLSPGPCPASLHPAPGHVRGPSCPAPGRPPVPHVRFRPTVRQACPRWPSTVAHEALPAARAKEKAAPKGGPDASEGLAEGGDHSSSSASTAACSSSLVISFSVTTAPATM